MHNNVNNLFANSFFVVSCMMLSSGMLFSILNNLFKTDSYLVIVM